MNHLTIDSTREIAPGVRMPLFGLGAFRMPDEAGSIAAIHTALDAGYRHIDTASIYGNEEVIGKAVAQYALPRDQLFITSKCWINEMGSEKTPAALEASLKRLGTDCVDLYLIHWPDDQTLPDCWEAMIRLRDEGKTRAIGVSNFTEKRLDRFLAYCGEKPAMNQFELHLFHQRTLLVKRCADEGIEVTAYCPIARAAKLDHPMLVETAARYSKTPAQLMIRWGLDIGCFTIPKSQTPERIRQNADIFDFTISAEDLQQLAVLDEQYNCSDWLPDPDSWY